MRSHPAAGRIAGAIGYLILLVASFWPQSLRPADTVGYIGDSLDSVYAIARNAAVIVSRPAELFDANILYPHRDALGLFGHRILLGLLALPVLWATHNPVLAYNCIVAAGCLLAAFAGWRLASALGISDLGAWAAGAVYGFNSYQVNEAPRADLLFHGFTTLALLSLVRFLATGRSVAAWAAAFLLLAQGYASNYLLLYGSVLVGLVIVAHLIARPARTLRRLPKLIPAALVAALLFVPMLALSLRVSSRYGLAREPPAGMDLGYYFSTSGTNLLYGAIGLPTGLQGGAPHFIGFLALALALLALATSRADAARAGAPLLPARVWVPAAGALALLFILLSLGMRIVLFGQDAGPGPYRILYDWVPGFRFIRHPERLALLAMLFVALLGGRGIDLVRARGWPLAASCALLLPFEHVAILPTTQRMPTSDHVPTVYTWLARQQARAVAELPGVGEMLVRKETVEEYFSLFHRKPIVHGYVSYPPPLTVMLRRAVEQFPSETSLEVFRRVGVDTLLLHHGRDRPVELGPAAARAGGLSLLQAFDEPWTIPAPEIWSPSTVGRPTATPIVTTRTEAYRLAPRPTVDAAPFPGGSRRRDAGWRFAASSGDPSLASDGSMDTFWRTDGGDADSTYEVEFPGPLEVSGVVIPVDWRTSWPSQFRVEGRAEDGTWNRLAVLDTGHVLRLVEELLRSPGRGRIGFDLGGAGLHGIRLRATAASSSKAWTVREIEVWTRER